MHRDTVAWMNFWKALPLPAMMVAILLLGLFAPESYPMDSTPTTPLTTSTNPAPQDPKILHLAAAGDIACVEIDDPACGHVATAELVSSGPSVRPGVPFDAVLALGDLQYERGKFAEFLGSYEPTWGKFRDITYPVLGNHEMLDGARGYRQYFDSRDKTSTFVGSFTDSWYAFRLGDWLLVGLNSNCGSGICEPNSPQLRFLRDVLSLDKGPCTLAFMHHPRWSSGDHGNDLRVENLWRTLASSGVDIVLSGHDHHYERFAPKTASGRSGIGLTQYVVGTGGAPLYEAGPTRLDATTVQNHHGILELELSPDSWSARFRATDGSVHDEHRAHCTARSTEAINSSTSPVMPLGTRTATTVSMPR